MNDGGDSFVGDISGEILDQLIHGWNLFGLRTPVLLDPALYLSFEKIPGASEIRKAASLDVDAMKFRQYFGELIIDSDAVGTCDARQGHLRQYTSMQPLHQVELRSDDVGVDA